MKYAGEYSLAMFLTFESIKPLAWLKGVRESRCGAYENVPPTLV